MISCAQRSVRWMLFLCAFTLNGYFSAYPLNASSSSAERERAEQAILQSAEILSAKDVDLRQRSLALASYRSAVLKLLPILKTTLLLLSASIRKDSLIHATCQRSRPLGDLA